MYNIPIIMHSYLCMNKHDFNREFRFMFCWLVVKAISKDVAFLHFTIVHPDVYNWTKSYETPHPA
jgi:hypothetical protein